MFEIKLFLHLIVCCITYAWIFRLFLVTPLFVPSDISCHVVISKQGSTIRALGYNRCVTRRRPHDEKHAVRFRESRESQSSIGHAVDQVISDEVARGCKHWHPLVPGRRYGKKSSLRIYVSPSISQLITNCGPFSRIKWDIYFYKEVFCSFIEFQKSCLIDIIMAMAIQHACKPKTPLTLN